MMKKIKTTLVVGTVLVSAHVTAQEAPVARPGKVQVCVACHGQNGIATISNYPNLAGQNRDYLIQALKAYQKGERSGGQANIMQQQAAALTEEDITEIADYYSKLD